MKLALILTLMTLCTAEWPTFGRDNQHTSSSPVGAQRMERERFSVDLSDCSSFQQHFGAPLITANNIVVIPIHGASCSRGQHVMRAYDVSGNVIWSMNSDFLHPPKLAGAGWVPQYQPVLFGEPGPTQRVYFAGPGGTIRWRDNLDQPSPITSGIVRYMGAQQYQDFEQQYIDTHFVNSGLMVHDGALFYSVRIRSRLEYPNLPQGSFSILVRVDVPTHSAAIVRDGPFIGGDNRFQRFPNQFTPAVSNDGLLVYWTVSNDSSNGPVRIVALNTTDLSVVHRAEVRDPRDSNRYMWLMEDSTAAPTIGPDGDVFLGLLGPNIRGQTRYSGWLLHWNRELNQVKTPGGFGWDDTATIVPSFSVPQYTGRSSYLLFLKFNDYLDREGGKGLHRLVIMDPNDETERDAKGSLTAQGQEIFVMRDVLSILAPEPKEPLQCRIPSQPTNCFQPRFEWCVNQGVFDRTTSSVFANNEDSYQYRWHLPTNTLAERFFMDTPQIEAYTPTSIGPDGAVYAINKGRMAVLEANPLETTTMVETSPLTTTTATTTTTTTTTEAPTTPVGGSPLCVSHRVETGDRYFLPQELNVRRGDTINFDWVGGFHNVLQVATEGECIPLENGFVSGPATDDLGVLYSLNATQPPGTYYYICGPHCIFGMHGLFTVSGTCSGRTSGDSNFDGVVDLFDILAVIENWGVCDPTNDDCVAVDFIADGLINLEDLLVVIANWTTQ